MVSIDRGLNTDAPIKRGRRHLRELMTPTEQGHSVWIVFVSMRLDLETIRPGESVDPDFGKFLVHAHAGCINLITWASVPGSMTGAYGSPKRFLSNSEGLKSEKIKFDI